MDLLLLHKIAYILIKSGIPGQLHCLTLFNKPPQGNKKKTIQSGLKQFRLERFTNMTNITRGIDHIGVTVPDMEEATKFFKNAFGAELAYDNLKPSEPPQEGTKAEKILGLTPGAKAVHIRLLVIGQSATIELFQFENTDHRQPLNAYDYGLQHVAFYVDDMDQAARQFTKSGGKLHTTPQDLSGNREAGNGHQFVYGRTPWGMLIELISYPEGMNYPKESETKRWTP